MVGQFAAAKLALLEHVQGLVPLAAAVWDHRLVGQCKRERRLVIPIVTEKLQFLEQSHGRARLARSSVSKAVAWWQGKLQQQNLCP